VPEAAAILAWLDAIMAELAQVKAELAALMPPAVNGAGSEGADDLAPRGWRPRQRPSGRPAARAVTASTGSLDSEQFRSAPRTCWPLCGRLIVR
jgi:hypothetical protein